MKSKTTRKKIAGIVLLVVAALGILRVIEIYRPRSFDLKGESWQHTLAVHTSGNMGSPEEVMAATLEAECAQYQLLAEKALVYRARTIALATRLKEKFKREEQLSGADLDELNQGTAAQLQLRGQLMQLALAHESWLVAPKHLLKKYGITPELRLKGMMLSISSSLLLYDNYLLSISIYEEDEKLRRFINQQDSGYQIHTDELAKITLSYNSAEKRERLRKAMRSYEDIRQKVTIDFFEDEQVAYLDILIRHSPSYAMVREYAPLQVTRDKIGFLEAITSDKLSVLGKEGLNIFSMIFGNTMGLIESRKGKLYDLPQTAASIRAQLKPGDILLEKTPFRLTDKFIPGHWGHAAIWVGNEAELKALGIWEHAMIKPYHSMIGQGKLVVEALRAGVQLNTLEHFLNVDDVGVLRDPTVLASKQKTAERIILALRQVGKDYDFNFDVETTDRIVCSELCYVVCTNIEWPTDKTLGRSTISPDNVASKAVEGRLELVLFYHDGKLVEKNPLRAMHELMKDEPLTSNDESGSGN